MKVVNLTPHAITFQAKDRVRTVYEPSGQVARVTQSDPVVLGDGPFKTFEHPSWGEVKGLPPYEDGVVYIVSSLVLQHCEGRDDVFAPATGPGHGCIRNMRGRVEAVTAFVAAPGV